MLNTIVTIFIISVQTDHRGGTDESYLQFVKTTMKPTT